MKGDITAVMKGDITAVMKGDITAVMKGDITAVILTLEENQQWKMSAIETKSCLIGSSQPSASKEWQQASSRMSSVWATKKIAR